jgi:hypothetical protein
MATIECHFCERQIDEREAKWFRPFTAAQRADVNSLQTFAAVSDQPVEGSVRLARRVRTIVSEAITRTRS